MISIPGSIDWLGDSIFDKVTISEEEIDLEVGSGVFPNIMIADLPDGSVLLCEALPYTIDIDKSGNVVGRYDPNEWERIARGAVIIKNIKDVTE